MRGSGTLDIAALEEAVENFESFCATCLKVKDKRGDLVPFVWNRAQRHINAALEAGGALSGDLP